MVSRFQNLLVSRFVLQETGSAKCCARHIFVDRTNLWSAEASASTYIIHVSISSKYPNLHGAREKSPGTGRNWMDQTAPVVIHFFSFGEDPAECCHQCAREREHLATCCDSHHADEASRSLRQQSHRMSHHKP